MIWVKHVFSTFLAVDDLLIRILQCAKMHRMIFCRNKKCVLSPNLNIIFMFTACCIINMIHVIVKLTSNCISSPIYNMINALFNQNYTKIGILSKITKCSTVTKFHLVDFESREPKFHF